MLLLKISLVSLLSVLAVNSQEICVCDTSTGCDLLCCCDENCSAEEKTTFSCETKITTLEVPSVTCVQASIFDKISPDESFSYSKLEGEVCLTSTSTVTKESSVNEVSFKPSSIQNSKSGPPTYTQTFGNGTDFVVNENNTMKASDPIYADTAGRIRHQLTLPSGLRGLCVQDTVFFLEDSESSCSIEVIGDMCKAGSKLDSTRPKISGLKLIENFRASLDETVDVTVKCISAGQETACLPPAIAGSDCNNVATKLDASFNYTATEGIVSATFKFQLESVSINSVTELLTSVSFVSQNQPEYPNPVPQTQRYMAGSTLVFAANGAKSNFGFSEANLECTAPGSIFFPISSISACKKPVDISQDFAVLFSSVVATLPDSLGKYANSDLADPAQWLDLSWDLPSTINSSHVPLGLDLVVKHQSFGSKEVPENEIVSAATHVSTVDLEYLERAGLLKGDVMFYISVRFVSVDLGSLREEDNFLSLVSRTLPDYNVPTQMLLASVAVFLVLSAGVFLKMRGMPEL